MHLHVSSLCTPLGWASLHSELQALWFDGFWSVDVMPQSRNPWVPPLLLSSDCCGAKNTQQRRKGVCFLCEGPRLAFRPALRAATATTYMLKRFLRYWLGWTARMSCPPFCDTKQLPENSPLLGTGSIKTSNRSKGLLVVASVNVLFSLEFWLFLSTAKVQAKLLHVDNTRSCEETPWAIQLRQPDRSRPEVSVEPHSHSWRCWAAWSSWSLCSHGEMRDTAQGMGDVFIVAVGKDQL